MFISHTPLNLPVSTANIAVESLAKESAIKPQIPETAPSSQSSNSKHSTDFSEQDKPELIDSLIQDKSIKEKNSQKDSSEEGASNGQKDDSNSEATPNKVDAKGNPLELDRAEQQQVAQLQARDREVRAHEAAHASVGGSLAGSPNLNFTSGPDGKRYATSGDVSIDISKVSNDPAATISKLQQVQRAALAPAHPSAQDRKVAAAASSGISEARVELNLESLEKSREFDNAQVDTKFGKGDDKEKKSVSGFNSKEETVENINPVKALRESRALEQKIEDSGALESQPLVHRFSLTA